MSTLVQQLLNGLILGSVYGLVAIGFTMTVGVIRVLNMAYPSTLLVGAFASWFCIVSLQLNPAAAFAIGVAAGGIFGVVVERIVIRPLRRGAEITPLIATVAVAIMTENVLALLFGVNPVALPKSQAPTIVHAGPILVTSHQLIALSLAAILMASVWAMIRWTRFGKQIRATAESHDTASLLGINVNVIIAVAIGVASAAGGAAGILVATLYNSTWAFMDFSWAVPGMAAMIVGGAESIIGGVVAGIIIGLAQVLIGGYISSQWAPSVVFGLLILMLIFRPRGLFPGRLS